MSSNRCKLLAALAVVTLTTQVQAAVSADEAKQLGSVLTPWGAEKAGNKDGTIPAYTGEAIKVPANYDPKDPGQYPDPFGEKPLYSITAQNYGKYADKLDGMQEMFKKFPNFRMDVYPSHRTFVYPKYVIDNSIKNAASCKAIAGGLKLDGCYAGMPFPIPKTGYEAMWNHLLQYPTPSIEANNSSWVTGINGTPVLQSSVNAVQEAPLYDPKNTAPAPSNAIYWRVRQNDIGPARKVGGILVILDSLDMVDVGRRVYQYVPGQRRVKLAPDLAYDTPSPNSGGAFTMDDSKGFMGAMDRFDFKLIGKKEKFIPYNAFGLVDYKACPDEKTVGNKNFAHPDCVRWELHRVWQVEARLKPGFRHIYSKRIFFWDEDAPGAGVVENYDAAGKLYRLVLQPFYPFYARGEGGNTDISLITDMQTGIWGVQGASSAKGSGWRPGVMRKDLYFSPEALAGEGVR